jgi:hypothetical protein
MAQKERVTQFGHSNEGYFMTSFLGHELKKQEILGKTDRLLSFDMTRSAYKMTPPKIVTQQPYGLHRETHRHTRPTILIFLLVFFA